MRTGAPWRDLPSRYEPWQTVCRRFALVGERWRGDGIDQLQGGPRPPARRRCPQKETRTRTNRKIRQQLRGAQPARGRADHQGPPGGRRPWPADADGAEHRQTRRTAHHAPRCAGRAPRPTHRARPAPHQTGPRRGGQGLRVSGDSPPASAPEHQGGHPRASPSDSAISPPATEPVWSSRR
ncbi:transposase [Streptomyces goshikiensis]|uniref:transposase n=1 Tax=Streptomyces goshikiensis TaxID=1942 RepID=UPI00367AA808